MSHGLRQAGKVLAGIAVVAGIGWAVAPTSSPQHSAAATSGCQDAAQITNGLTGGQTPPESVMSDLVQLAPNVHDAGLSGAFRAFSDSYGTDNVQGGLRAVADIDASCQHAGLP